MAEQKKQKSYFLNFQFILGLVLFIGFIAFALVYNMSLKSDLARGIPFIKANYSKFFLGTDASGFNILKKTLILIISDAFLTLSAWLFALLISIPLGYVSSKRKWLGTGLKEVLGFGPSIILAGVLIYLINMRIYGIAISLGVGMTPYFISRFSECFNNESKAYVYFESIHALFFSALIIQLGSFLGLYTGLGFEIKSNLNYAFKYLNMIIPYFAGSFLLILFPSLMLRGIKDAHTYNIGIELGFTEGEKITPKDKKKLEEINEAIVEEQVKEEHTIEELDTDEIFGAIEELEEIETRICTFLVDDYGFSHAYLYRVKPEGYEIKKICKKVVPLELIDIKKENEDFQSKAYKFAFLDTLREKSKPYFVYPGKDNYDRIFHHLSIDNKITYIIEVSYNKTLKNPDNELDRLLRFIPHAEVKVLLQMPAEIVGASQKTKGQEIAPQHEKLEAEPQTKYLTDDKDIKTVSDEPIQVEIKEIEEDDIEGKSEEKDKPKKHEINISQDFLKSAPKGQEKRDEILTTPIVIGTIEKVREKESDSGERYFEVTENVGKVVQKDTDTGKKFFQVYSKSGNIIKEAKSIDNLLGPGQKFFEKGMKPVTGKIKKNRELIDSEDDIEIVASEAAYLELENPPQPIQIDDEELDDFFNEIDSGTPSMVQSKSKVIQEPKPIEKIVKVHKLEEFFESQPEQELSQEIAEVTLEQPKDALEEKDNEEIAVDKTKEKFLPPEEKVEEKQTPVSKPEISETQEQEPASQAYIEQKSADEIIKKSVVQPEQKEILSTTETVEQESTQKEKFVPEYKEQKVQTDEMDDWLDEDEPEKQQLLKQREKTELKQEPPAIEQAQEKPAPEIIQPEIKQETQPEIEKQKETFKQRASMLKEKIVRKESDSDEKVKDEIHLDFEVETDKTTKTTFQLDRETGEVLKTEKTVYREQEPLREEYEDDFESSFDPSGLFVTRYEDKLNKGLRYLKAKDYNRALFFLKEALMHNQDSYQVYMAMGHVYRHKGLYSEALDNYRSALQKNKYSSNAYNYMGNIFYVTRKYRLALSAWEKAYSIDPGRTIIKKNIEKLKKIIDKSE